MGCLGAKGHLPGGQSMNRKGLCYPTRPASHTRGKGGITLTPQPRLHGACLAMAALLSPLLGRLTSPGGGDTTHLKVEMTPRNPSGAKTFSELSRPGPPTPVSEASQPISQGLLPPTLPWSPDPTLPLTPRTPCRALGWTRGGVPAAKVPAEKRTSPPPPSSKQSKKNLTRKREP